MRRGLLCFCLFASIKGTTWSPVLSPSGGTRSNFTLVQLDSKRLFVGFGRVGGTAAPSNHIITTSELAGEIQEIQDLPSTFALENAALKNVEGTLYLMGGYDINAGSVVNTVYTSIDEGSSWTEVPQHVPANKWWANYICSLETPDSKEEELCTWWNPRQSFGSVFHDTHLYVLGGLVYEDDETAVRSSDVWRYKGPMEDSVTGAHHWTRLQRTSTWGGRSEFGCVSHGDYIYVMGGLADNPGTISDLALGEVLNDVYRAKPNGSSTAALSWQVITRSANWPARASFATLSKDNLLYLFGGYSFSSTGHRIIQNDVWFSTSGSSWQIAVTGSGMPSSFPSVSAVLLDGPEVFLFMGDGTRTRGQNIPSVEALVTDAPTLGLHVIASSRVFCQTQNGTECNALGKCSIGSCACNTTSDGLKHVASDPLLFCTVDCNLGYELTFTDISRTTKTCSACAKAQYGAFDRDNAARCYPCPQFSTTQLTASIGKSSCVELSESEVAREDELHNQKSSATISSVTWITGGIGLLVLILLVILFVVKNRRKERDWTKTFDTTSSFRSSPSVYDTLSSTEKAKVEQVLIESDGLMDSRLSTDAIQMDRVIGTGSFGEVLCGRYKDQTVAIKRLLRNRMNATYLESFAQEIATIRNLFHPNIVTFIGVAWQGSSVHDMCIVTEYMERGDLHSVLNDPMVSMDWKHRKITMSLDIAQGLNYLHERDPIVIHRDIKSMNVLVDLDFTCKLSDFGLSRTLSLDETMTVTGTSLWFPPEMIRGEQFTEKADIFSFGIVLAEIDTRQLPYQSLRDQSSGISGTKLMHLVAYEGLRPALSESCPEFIRNLIAECLDADPSKRPSADAIARILNLNLPREYTSIFSVDL